MVDLSHQVQCHEYLGYIAYRQGRYDDAAKSLQTALRVDEEPPPPRRLPQHQPEKCTRPRADRTSASPCATAWSNR